MGQVIDTSLAPALGRFAAAHPHADLGWGDPGSSGGWFRYEDLCDQEVPDRILERMAQEYKTTPSVAGSYTFRAANYLAVGLAGFLFVMERRVPRLHGSVALLDRNFLNGLRLLEPRAIVLETDSAAGTPGVEAVPDLDALTDALFDEVSRLAGPLLAAFQARKLVAPVNAWGILIDSLASGFLAAGRAGIGLDAAWASWHRAIAGRSFPVRRRPRRVQFDVDGQPHEVMVRSHCCLYFTLPRAKEAAHQYCSSCYLETDERRIQRLIASYRAQAEKRHDHPNPGEHEPAPGRNEHEYGRRQAVAGGSSQAEGRWPVGVHRRPGDQDLVAQAAGADRRTDHCGGRAVGSGDTGRRRLRPAEAG